MSDDGVLGTVETFAGGILQVTVDDEGDVTLDRLDGRSCTTVLRPDAQAKLRELLDRAAMPGQPATAATEAAAGDSDEVPVRRVTLWLCDLCLDGAGGECHSPGCALWINRAPDISLRDNVFVTVHGEPPATEAGPTAEQVRRCGDSEDPNHQCVVCFDYAAEDYRPARLKAEADRG